MIIKNLTPHSINIVKDDESVITIEPSGTIARISSKKEFVNKIEGINFFKGVMGEIYNLPEYEAGTILIVSGMLSNALGSTRPDVFAPAELIRDDEGKVIGTKGLIS